MGITFTLIEFTSFFEFSKNVYFIPPISLFVIYFFLKFYIKKHFPSKKHVVEKEHEKKLNNNSSDSSTPNGFKTDWIILF